MKKINVLIIYPVDNDFKKTGGIEISIKSAIEYSPQNVEIELVGIVNKDINSLEAGKWHQIAVNNRKINFFPVLSVKSLNNRPLIPLTLKFTLSLWRYKRRINFKNRIIIFHRLEPAFVLSNIKEQKILFDHGDIRYFNNKHCESKWRKLRWLYFLIEPFFIKQMQKVFVVTNSGCEYYRHTYPEYSSRILFLPTWYEPNIFTKFKNIDKEDILKSYGIANSKFLLLFIGRLEKAKDPLLLLDSFFLIARFSPEVHLIIVGDGTLKNKLLQRISKLKLDNKVSLLGRKNQHEIAKLMNISDLLLLTSAFEGMPRVILEALACGLPVVATDVGGCRLVIEKNISGKLVSSRDPKEIADAAVDILVNLQNYKTCQTKVTNFSVEKVIFRFYNELEKCKN